MFQFSSFVRRMAPLATLAAVVAAAPAGAAEPVKIAIFTFLSGAGASAYGVPARAGSELVIDAINEGRLPAPYDSPGLGGRPIDAEFIDEMGGNARQVTEYRNAVQRGGAEVVLGYISSGTCQAIGPVAEELETLTVMATCATPRVFEEGPKRYVFRTLSHAAADGIAAARYVAATFTDLKAYTGINQNYAFGQDSWRDFVGAMNAVSEAEASERPQWPKLFQGQYGTEVSALMLDPAELVFSSIWGGDFEAFVQQAAPRGFFDRKAAIFSVGGVSVDRIGDRIPDGVVIGDRGPYGITVRERKTPLNEWFISEFRERFGEYPSSPAYHYAQALLATKIAYDEAQAGPGETDKVIEAFRGIAFDSFSTRVEMKLADGHQAVTEHVFGRTAYDREAKEMRLVDIKFFPASCVMPPEGVEAEAWIADGMPGAEC